MAGQSAARFVPPKPTLSTARSAARTCRGCDLWRHATQTVFGSGSENAEVVLVGEQPGHEEDLAGKPFVGPAGRILARALEDAGIPHERTYLTNVVKHFKWEPRGKRRIHAKPKATEIVACRPWLDVELALVKPRIVVCLGATAAKALLGASFKVTAQRGVFLQSSLAPLVLATVHPSSILRVSTSEARHQAMAEFVRDLKNVATYLGWPP
jgi:DNA polymerase